ncbi:hypothetical protein GJ25_gp090 [Mycobacterium phage Hawkeye]|uniref:Uncharacterized protein n=1 Tax=Mycobacterium phage Hawkeye TaxID=1458711 RepID=X2KSS5_9CAUD|nr:hypothetical protein GJ25_gp090 [Mycobacterium phage Hawkeye]AHN84101.1 hypothetical protein PBI_HAWKEYE_90 [Mycobacterium phage Hawkeye]
MTGTQDLFVYTTLSCAAVWCAILAALHISRISRNIKSHNDRLKTAESRIHAELRVYEDKLQWIDAEMGYNNQNVPKHNIHGMPMDGVCPHGVNRRAYFRKHSGIENVPTNPCPDCVAELTPIDFTWITTCPYCMFTGEIPFVPFGESNRAKWLPDDRSEGGNVLFNCEQEEGTWKLKVIRTYEHGGVVVYEQKVPRKFTPVVMRTCPSCTNNWYQH